MKKLFTKIILPSALVAGSLGAGVGIATVPAGAVAGVHTTIAATKTWSGTIKTVNPTKHKFTLRHGSRTFVVHYTSTTPFTKGSAANLVKGASVSVTGSHKQLVITATSISA